MSLPEGGVMPFEILHFRDSAKIIKKKGMIDVIHETLMYIDAVLYQSFLRGSFLKTALDDLGWRENGDLTILDGRKYQFKGFMNRVALEASLYTYEDIWRALFRLQVGFDKGLLDVGLVVLTGQRSEKSPLGSSAELVRSEILSLHPTISLPVAVALYDFGKPRFADEKDEPVQDMETQHSELREMAA
jgi:hypothetical protein